MVKVKQFETKSVANIIKNMYLNEETADVHFVFDVEHRVPAHKNILASESKVFHTMFVGALKEKGQVKITDASPKCFEGFDLFNLRNTSDITGSLSV